MTYEELWRPLVGRYGTGEAKAIVRFVLERRFGLQLTDIVCGGVERLSPQDGQLLQQMALRLQKGEPVQYVLGEAEFYGRWFEVSPGTLIPRPETEELCRWIVDSLQFTMKSEQLTAGSDTAALSTINYKLSTINYTLLTILDIGTGSGCIACTLAAELPGANVTAWDISEKALHIAQKNAKRTIVNVQFQQVDILQSSIFNPQPSIFDVIVSNPPYICNKERAQMEPHVLNHEPKEALFVPDDNPLLFYRAICHYALQALAPGGMLFFELNALYAHETSAMLQEQGFGEVTIRNDQFGKPRFIRACREKQK